MAVDEKPVRCFNRLWKRRGNNNGKPAEALARAREEDNFEIGLEIGLDSAWIRVDFA